MFLICSKHCAGNFVREMGVHCGNIIWEYSIADNCCSRLKVISKKYFD